MEKHIEEKLAEKYKKLADRFQQACCCIGPQDGQPLCPCRMRNLQVVNGRYVEVIDHGKAPDVSND